MESFQPVCDIDGDDDHNSTCSGTVCVSVSSNTSRSTIVARDKSSVARTDVFDFIAKNKQDLKLARYRHRFQTTVYSSTALVEATRAGRAAAAAGRKGRRTKDVGSVSQTALSKYAGNTVAPQYGKVIRKADNRPTCSRGSSIIFGSDASSVDRADDKLLRRPLKLAEFENVSRDSNRTSVKDHTELSVIHGDAEPGVFDNNTKPHVVKTFGKQRVGKTRQELRVVKSDTKPLVVKSDTKPLVVKSDRKPLVVKSDRKPVVVNSDRKPHVVKIDKKPPPVVRSDKKPPVVRSDAKKPVVSITTTFKKMTPVPWGGFGDVGVLQLPTVRDQRIVPYNVVTPAAPSKSELRKIKNKTVKDVYTPATQKRAPRTEKPVRRTTALINRERRQKEIERVNAIMLRMVLNAKPVVPKSTAYCWK